MIVYGERLRPWIEAKLGLEFPNAEFLGVTHHGKPVCVVAFNQWTGDDVEINVFAEAGTGSRTLLNLVWAYVFEQLKCARCSVSIREDNEKSLRLAERLGFVLEGRKRKAKDGKDVLIFGLLKEDHGKFPKASKTNRP